MSRLYKIKKKQYKKELEALKEDKNLKKSKYKVFRKQHNLTLKDKTKVILGRREKTVLTAEQKEQYKKLKTDKKESQELHTEKKSAYKKRYPSKVKSVAYVGASQLKTRTANKVMSQDEDLARYVTAKNRYGSTRASIESGVRGTKIASKVVYGGSNRLYNKVRGRGFTRTPQEFTIKNKVTQKISNNKRVQSVANVRKKTKKYTKPFEGVFRISLKKAFKNPFKLSGLLSLLFLFCFFGLFFVSLSPSAMKEDNMTDTWIYFTKLDKENSTNRVNYNSDIEEYIYFLNYRYDKVLREIYTDDNVFAKNHDLRVAEAKKKSLPETKEGKEYLEKMWKFLNGDYENLKTIDDLMNEEGFLLDDKEKKEYREYIEISNEIGKFPHLQEVNNFLFSKQDQEYNKPLKVLERFGYTTPTDTSETTTFVANANQYIYAPYTGTVSIDGNDLTITQGLKRITFYNVINVRVLDKSQAIRGEMIAQTNGEDRLVVKYEKKINKEWKAVNIGFYLPKVEYIQKTEVIKDFKLTEDKLGRAKEFIDKVREIEPNATNEGIAAILGNFDVESGINPKRAEGDYLPPPIGVVDDSSWDNDEWLSIGGVEIYNGRYPNILRRGLGLGQWTDTMDGAIKHTLLRNFANERGSKWYYMDLQIDFMFNGDSPYYTQQFRDIITSTEDVAVLTRRFLNNWEGNPSDKIDNRIEHAKNYYNYLSRSVDGQPLEEMDKVVVTSPFGAVRDIVLQDGRVHSDVHNGTDLVYQDGRSNAPIYAVEGGEVVWAKADTYGGLGVIIKHSYFYSYYWHLSNIDVTEGQIVESGTQLGNMGTTGLSTGVHLHLGFSYGLWEDFYDPKPYLNLN